MRWVLPGLLLFAVMPGTSTYQLNSYGFGSGGASNSSTSTYALEGTTGELSGQSAITATYSVKPGFIETQQANVPKILTLGNGSNTYYNKLHFVIDQQSNPTDALYALSISTDNFASNVNYVKSDLTVGGALALADYKTYTAWGGASGADIIGLSPGTTYYLRAKVTQGKFSESGYGPVASASTVNPQLSFSISTSSINMGSLLAGTVVDAAESINITFATNAASGGDVYISGTNTGLRSPTKLVTITSATGDLSALSRGFGARVTATGATSGTFSSASPYNGASNNIGVTDTTIRRIITANGPVVGGTGSVILKAKSSVSDTAATDYTETITMLASASF